MGTDKDTRTMQMLKLLGPTVAAVIFSGGLYASQIVSDKRELVTRIDNVQQAARVDLDSSVRIRGVQVDALERRVSSLEVMARENTAINMEILRKLTSLEAASLYQSEALKELKDRLREDRK